MGPKRGCDASVSAASRQQVQCRKTVMMTAPKNPVVKNRGTLGRNTGCEAAGEAGSYPRALRACRGISCGQQNTVLGYDFRFTETANWLRVSYIPADAYALGKS